MIGYPEPEPPVDPPEADLVGYCKVCGGEIYDGSVYYEDYSGSLVHDYDDCLDDLWNGLTTFEKADVLGLERRE